MDGQGLLHPLSLRPCVAYARVVRCCPLCVAEEVVRPLLGLFRRLKAGSANVATPGDVRPEVPLTSGRHSQTHCRMASGRETHLEAASLYGRAMSEARPTFSRCFWVIPWLCRGALATSSPGRSSRPTCPLAFAASMPLDRPGATPGCAEPRHGLDPGRARAVVGLHSKHQSRMAQGYGDRGGAWLRRTAMVGAPRRDVTR